MDVNIKGKFDDLAPDKSMMIWKIEKMLDTGETKDLSTDDLAEMSGIIAEAAAVYLYAEPTPKNNREIYETLMGIAKDLILNSKKENLTVLKKLWPKDDVWKKVEEEYFKYYVDRFTPDLEKEGYQDEDDDGFIGEYPRPEEDEEYDEDFIGEYPMPPTK